MQRVSLKHVFVIICLLFVCYSCKNSYKSVFEYKAMPNPLSVNDDTVRIDSVNKFWYSRLSKKETFGLNALYNLPDSLQGKELYVIFEGRARTNYAFSNSLIVIAVFNDIGQQIIWRVFPLKYNYVGINNWSFFKDSLYLAGSFDNRNYKTIQTMANLSKSESEVFDMEYLNVNIKVKD